MKIRLCLTLFVIAGLWALAAGDAHAATGGANHIWEFPLQILQRSIGGPLGRSVAAIAISVAGFSWLFGSHERGMSAVLSIAIGLAFVLGATQVILELGFPGATF
jgi:type IV secretory pathway VirB2 component (pilin)